MVPRDVIMDSRISLVARAAYEYLALKSFGAPVVRITLSELARNLRRGRDTARRALRNLEVAGHVEKLPTPNGVRYQEYRLTHSIHATGQRSGAEMPRRIGAMPPVASVPSVKPSTNGTDAILTYTHNNNSFYTHVAHKATKRRNDGPDPSDDLVEALRVYTDQSFTAAREEGRKALRTLGKEREQKLIAALRHPKTRNADKPIGFAIAAVRDHGGVLDYRS